MRQTLVALALIAAACGGGSIDVAPQDQESAPTTATDPTTTTSASAPSLPSDGFPEGPSALDDMVAAEFPAALIPVDEILSGGPPPDGIPPIDEPMFIDVAAADEWLSDEEPVVALEIGGEARAYPVQIMIWHEIVNDVVGGVPVAITYCPLCNSAVSYERVIDGHETTFGTSGRLFASALVMYDRATESLWTHYDGRAVVGVLTGFRLDPIASPLLSWGAFKEAYPDALVLDREETGFGRPYGTNPYQGYDNPNARPFLFRGDVDERSVAMQRVVGVRDGDEARAWTLEAISGDGLAATNTELAGRSLVIFWVAGQSSALEAPQIVNGRDVGSVGVFDPTVDGETLTFGVQGDGFVDDQTGSTWDITGRALDGTLRGSQMERVPHLDTFWFAWSTYAPGTDLIED